LKRKTPKVASKKERGAVHACYFNLGLKVNHHS